MLKVKLNQMVTNLWFRLIPPLSFKKVPDFPVECFGAVEDVVFQLVGQSPQICTVSHGRTFEYQKFSNFRYAIFQYKSQKWMPKDDLSV